VKKYKIPRECESCGEYHTQFVMHGYRMCLQCKKQIDKWNREFFKKMAKARKG